MFRATTFAFVVAVHPSAKFIPIVVTNAVPVLDFLHLRNRLIWQSEKCIVNNLEDALAKDRP
jgi:hypothetical protein